MQPLAILMTHLPDVQSYHGPTAERCLIEQVQFDSRKAAPGTLFVAWIGRNADTHRFIPHAIAQGATAILGTATLAELKTSAIELPPTIPYLQVSDSRRALAICAAALHDFPSQAMTVIGITGTDGKTTTCSLLEAILTAHTANQGAGQTDGAGRVGVITTVGARICGVESDTGFHVTTPDAPDVQRFLAAMRDKGCSHAIVETTSHGLAQSRVAAVAYDIAAVTNITHEHLDEHGTRDAYVAAKALLFRALSATPPKAGIPRCAVLNADDIGADTGSFDALQQALAEAAAQQGVAVPVRTYGLIDGPRTIAQLPDLYAHSLDYAPDSTRMTVEWWGGAFPLSTQLIGDFNVYNVLCAVTVGLVLAVPVPTIQQAIADFRGVLGRMERVDRGQPFLAVVDFAHSPVSLERALKTLRKLVGIRPNGEAGRLIAIFGSAGLRDRAKRRLMGQVSGQLADFTVITAEDPRTEELALINAAIAAGVETFTTADKYTIVPDRSDAIQYGIDIAEPGDVVAAFGKGHERSMCFGETEYPWSDQDAMLAALARRAEGSKAVGQ